MKISVIIPCLNEEQTIAVCLENLSEDFTETIVVDGGSQDQSLELVKDKARVVFSPKGRAKQMNEGARLAQGEIFLFLHADTILPPNAYKLIHSTIQKGVRAGRFQMRFDYAHPLLCFYAFFTRFHIFSYGDQAFFVKKELFWKVGAFPENVAFEDMVFYKRLRQEESPTILNAKVTTSARRFLKNGIIRQAMIDFLFVVGFFFGWEKRMLMWKEKWYRDDR